MFTLDVALGVSPARVRSALLQKDAARNSPAAKACFVTAPIAPPRLWQPVADAVGSLQNVVYLVLTSGEHDLLAEVVCRSPDELLDVESWLGTLVRGVPLGPRDVASVHARHGPAAFLHEARIALDPEEDEGGNDEQHQQAQCCRDNRQPVWVFLGGGRNTACSGLPHAGRSALGPGHFLFPGQN